MFSIVKDEDLCGSVLLTIPEVHNSSFLLSGFFLIKCYLDIVDFPLQLASVRSGLQTNDSETFSRSVCSGNRRKSLEVAVIYAIKAVAKRKTLWLKRDSNPSPLRCRCSARPTELSSQSGAGHIVSS